jgi:hypothetical protein
LGCIQELLELLFFSPNQRQGHSMIICIGSAKAPNVRKVAFKKYLQANRSDEQ